MKTLTLKHSKQKVFQAVKKAVENLDLEVKSSDLEEGRLLLYSGGGLFSFGNDVLVKISSKNGKSLLRVSANSAAAIQVIDWGTNNDLERDLVNEVKEILDK